MKHVQISIKRLKIHNLMWNNKKQNSNENKHYFEYVFIMHKDTQTIHNMLNNVETQKENLKFSL